MSDYIIKIQNRTLIATTVVLIVFIIISVVLFLELKESKRVINCDSFSSYEEALKALPDHKGLDKNSDNRPCEKLLKK